MILSYIFVKRKSARKRSSHKSSRNSFVFWNYLIISSLIIVFVVKPMYKSLQTSNVLGVSLLAQEMPPPGNENPPQQPQQPPPQEQAPMQQTQPQQQMQQEQAQQQPNQQQVQQMTDQQKQMMQQAQQNPQQYQQMSPEQKQTMSKQMQQQYQQPQQQIPMEQRRQMDQQTQNPNTTTNKPNMNTGSTNDPSTYQPMTAEQQKQMYQQAQQYQGATEDQKKQMDQMFQKSREQSQQQYQQTQQQWQQDAAKNGFQISEGPSSQYQQYLLQTKTNTTTNQTGVEKNTQQTTNQTGSQFQPLPPSSVFPSIQGAFFVQGSSNNSQNTVNLNDGNTKIQLGTQNSNLFLKAVRADGTKVEIDKTAFEKIATAIKLETGSEITQKENKFVMKRGDIEAQTKFPVSFNVATKTFTVQTPKGEHEVTILPDEAVQKLMENNIIASAPTSQIELTEYNNQPVYEVSGSTKQKMFGFLPINIEKTSVVSAQTGSVVNTNQGIFSRFIDTLSF